MSAQLLPCQSQFLAANFESHSGASKLRLFPADGTATVIALPFALANVKFSVDGRSLYASLATGSLAKLEQMPGLVRIDYPVRSAPLSGTQGFGIRDFGISQDGGKVVLAGNRKKEGRSECGFFEVTVSTGAARQALAQDCSYRWWGTDLTLSPDGNQAIASYGNSNSDYNYRLDLIDLARGTTKSLGDLSRPTWSPDGKWIAAIEWKKKRLILLDAKDPSRRRNIGSTIAAAWSPDSRYLLIWHYHFLKCGFFIDVEPPASLEMLDIASGKNTLIRSSQCQLIAGPIGWLSSHIEE